MPRAETAGDERILVVGPAWVGDMVMAQALYKTLRQRFPHAAIDVLAPRWSLPLIERMPEVEEAIEMPLGHGDFGFFTRRRLGRSLRSRGYTRAIVLPRSFKAALVPFFARIPVRTGYRGEMRFGLLNDLRPLDKRVLTQTVQRQVALALPPGAEGEVPAIPEPRLTVDEARCTELFQTLRLYRGRPVVAFMPGAEYGPAKQWPPASYAALAERLVAQGYQVWILGSAKERDLGEQIAAGREWIINLAGRTQLVDAVDLLSLARCAVTNDSGLMHVAAAVGVPLVAIYGSSSPGYTPPLSSQAEVVYHGLDCSPCFERRCPLGHTNCLNGIGVDEVLVRCRLILDRQPSKPGKRSLDV